MVTVMTMITIMMMMIIISSSSFLICYLLYRLHNLIVPLSKYHAKS